MKRGRKLRSGATAPHSQLSDQDAVTRFFLPCHPKVGNPSSGIQGGNSPFCSHVQDNTAVVAKADWCPPPALPLRGWVAVHDQLFLPDHKEAFTKTVSETTNQNLRPQIYHCLAIWLWTSHFTSLPQCSHLSNVYNTTKLMRLLQGLRELLKVLATGTCPINTTCCFLTCKWGWGGRSNKNVTFLPQSGPNERWWLKNSAYMGTNHFKSCLSD